MKEQMKQHKMTEREIFEKYDNLNENEQHTKNNKEVYAKTDVMTTVIQRSRGEKKDAKEKQINSEKKKKNPNSEIPECPEHEVKSKIGNIFVDEKILEEFL